MTETIGPPARIRRRLMRDADVEAAATLLNGGFPKRSRQQWLDGLERQRTRPVPEGYPRFGLVLEADDRLVGIVLTIYSDSELAGRRAIRCHFSSWYVDSAFKAVSSLLVTHLLRDRDVTFVNISPAPHTREIIETQGFRPYGTGWLLTVPWTRVPRESVRVTRIRDCADLPPTLAGERDLLERHQALGCLCLLVEAGDGWHPFVFSRRRRLRRALTTSYLVYCRDIADYARFAGPLGRTLLRHGILTVLADKEGLQGRIAGRAISRSQDKYFRGPDKPRAGDNAFSEVAVFSD